MAQKMYVVTCEGEPRYVTPNLFKVKRECQEWYDNHYDNFSIQRDYQYWLEDRKYPDTDDGEERAWNDYVEEQFNDGTWGDYAWYEVLLK